MRLADKYLIAFVVLMIFGVTGIGIYAGHLENKIEEYKHQMIEKNAQLSQKDSQIYERQLKYEEEKSVKDRLGRELVDAQNRLAEAAERERARGVRASRSRNGSASSRTTVKRSSSLGYGSVHDITMYCPTGNRTASGKVPSRGMVATISRSIPFGTRIYIDGLGEFTVEDRIGHGSEFDIFTPSCGEARRFGRKHLRVTILDTD